MLHTMAMGSLPPTLPMPSVWTMVDMPATNNAQATSTVVSAGPNPNPADTSKGAGSAWNATSSACCTPKGTSSRTGGRSFIPYPWDFMVIPP